MQLRTRIFDATDGSFFYEKKYKTVTLLAKAMGLSLSQVCRVRAGKRGINEIFIKGVKQAFPEYEIGELFYFEGYEIGELFYFEGGE